MKFTILTTVLSVMFLSLSCSKSYVKPANAAPPNIATPAPAQTAPPPIKDGNYPGKGTVTKIDLNMGSVDLNHENIEGLMPAMQMGFYVTDKALLKGLTVGEKVDFVIEYKGGRETINSIQKAK